MSTCANCGGTFARPANRGPIPRYCSGACRQAAHRARHGDCLAARAAGFDRDLLVEVLIYHWRRATSGCGCGWGKLGHSHADHIADVYEASWHARNDRTEPAR